MTKPNLTGLRWLVLLLLPLPLSAQQVSPYDLSTYQYLEAKGRIPREFLTSTDQKFDYIVDSLSAISAGRSDRKQMERYWRHYLHYLSSTLSSGQVVFGDPITAYLNEIKDKLLADDPELQTKIRIYLSKDPEVNAYAGGDGKIFVNIGLVAHMESEDELAFVLAHEISHYTEAHGLEAFRHREAVENESNSLFGHLFGSERPFDEFAALRDRSQADELDADIKGAALFLKSQYRPTAMLSALTILHRSYLPFAQTPLQSDFLALKPDASSRYWLNELRPLSNNENFVDESHSHPNIARRKTALGELYGEQLATHSNRESSVNTRFSELQLLARFELIRLQMLYFQYQSALFNLNELMLQQPGNSFLMEARALSMYALAIYRISGQGDRLIPSYSLVEGPFQQLAYLLRKMGKDDYYAAALQLLYSTAQARPDKKDQYKALGTILSGYYRHYAEPENQESLKRILTNSHIELSEAFYQSWLPTLWEDSTPWLKRLPSKKWLNEEEREKLAAAREERSESTFDQLRGQPINVISPHIEVADPESLESQEMAAAAYQELEIEGKKLARKMGPEGLKLHLNNNLLSDEVKTYNQRSRLLEISQHQMVFNRYGLLPETTAFNSAERLGLSSPYVMVASLNQNYYSIHHYNNCVIDIDAGIKLLILEDAKGRFEVNDLAPAIIDNLKAIKK